MIERLVFDLKGSFPDIRGFSSRNLNYMAFFAEPCQQGPFGQQPAAQLPWFHIVTLLTKLDDEAGREWYATQAVTNDRPRSTLNLNIKNQLRQRQGGAVTNFERRLPAADSALARESVRAKLRLMVKRILRKYKYPPDNQEAAIQTVLQQAEALGETWM